MIAFIEGILVEKQPTRVVVNVGGIGYELFIPLSSYDRLPREQEACRLRVCEHIREDSHQLFGFATEAERELFVLLNGVSGIGPRVALSALSGLSVNELRLAVAGGDAKRLSTISGIGKKTAERMVVELRDKIGRGEVLAAAAAGREPAPADMRSRDAVLALISLGYKRAEAEAMVQDAVKGAPQLEVEDLIRRALAK